ncbi:hypothetical protein QQZ08_003236 [Neonectria magnoliae]|uniref:Uncharacterized protein n=1 Tax=Neonectria magnoliae TaxID=2732573 RepID=A0ABR1IBP6_9HYPO
MVGGESAGSRRPGPSAYLLFSKLKVKNIPVITQLRKELDYGHAGSQRGIVFYNTLRSYILSFKSSNGIPGVEFLTWRFRPHQIGLLEIVSDKDGKGAHFWPDDVAAPNYGKLQYSKDHRRIRRLLTQLFFRINQEHRRKRSPVPANNPQQPEKPSSTYRIRDYSSWSAANARQESTTELQLQPQPQQMAVNEHQRGHNAKNAISLDGYLFDEDLLTETKPDKSAWDNATTATPEPPYTSQSFEVSSREHLNSNDQGLQEEITTRSNHTQAAPVAPMIDPFDGPSSPGPDLPPDVTQKSPNTNKRPASHDGGEEIPQAKRVWCGKCGTTHQTVRTGTTTKNPLHCTAPSRPPSSRQRKHTHKDGYLCGPEYDEVLQSPPSSVASSASTPDPEDDSQNANVETEPIPPQINTPEQSAQTAPRTVEDASQGTSVETGPNPPVPSISENSSHSGTPTVKDGLQSSKVDTKPIPRLTTAPKELVQTAPVTMDNASQNAKRSDEDRQPPSAPPRALDRNVNPKLAPNPQPDHEPEEESSKKKRLILPKVNLIFTVESQKANKGWVPKGSFQQKSLGEVVDELPLEKPFNGLRLVLQEIPGDKFEYEVLLGDEDVFSSIKAIFGQRISEVRRGRAGSAKTVTFEMSIRPLQNGEDGDSGEDKGDIDEEEYFVF